MIEEDKEVIELPKGWVETHFSDLFIDPKNDVVDGPFGSNLKASEYIDKGTPIIRLQNIDRNRFINKNIQYITNHKATELKRHSYQIGDVVITKLGDPLGKACIIPQTFEDGIIVADLVRARLRHEHISKSFLIYSINSLYIANQLKEKTKGTTRPRVNLNHIREIHFYLPPLPEQHRIVEKIEELFSELDQGIETLKTAKQQLKIYRQAVLKWAFEGKLTRIWREHTKLNGITLKTGEELLVQIKAAREQQYQQQVKDWEVAVVAWEKDGKKDKKPSKPQKPKDLPPLSEDELAELLTLPEGWCWVKVDTICDVVRGASPRPAGDPKYFGGDIPWITVGELTKDENTYLTKVEYFVTEKGKENSRFVEPNTLLLTNSGATLGVPKITKIAGCINDGSVAFFNLDDKIKYYLYWFLNSQTTKLRGINQGAAQPNLNTSIVGSIVIPLVHFEEQDQIVQEIEARFSVCDQLEATINENLQLSEALRQSILKKAFEGKLVPQDPNDEPAEALLARINAERQSSQNQSAVS